MRTLGCPKTGRGHGGQIRIRINAELNEYAEHAEHDLDRNLVSASSACSSALSALNLDPDLIRIRSVLSTGLRAPEQVRTSGSGVS